MEKPLESPLLERSPEEWDGLLTPPGAKLWPAMSDRDAWSGLLQHPWPAAYREATRKRVQHILGKPWPMLSAGLLRSFADSGDRVGFQKIYFARRERITDLALLMAMDGGADHVDELVDGIWLLCEESSWCIPAHWHLAALPRRPVQSLPPEEEQVDLFAAETASLVALVAALCGEALVEWDAGLQERLRREVFRRCLEPVLTSEAWFWWDGHHNWSPWIAANLLTAGALFLEDRETDRQLVARLAGVLSRYLDHIPEDGYCDEGPSYWNAGTGMTVVALELIRQRTCGKVDGFALPKVKAMGSYLTGTYLGHRRYIATADSNPNLQLHPEIPIRLGQRCELPELVERGWDHHNAKGYEPISPLMGGGGPGPRLRRLWWLDHASKSTVCGQTTYSLDTWFPSGQLAVMREGGRPGRGFTLAVKYGHNRENHNHLDVGQVVVHEGEAALLIDPGVDAYRSAHFSPDRYTVPWVGAGAHNVPRINETGQTPGTGFGYFEPPRHAGLSLSAQRVSFDPGDTVSRVSGDLSGVYPEVENLVSLERTAELNRKPEPGVHITDILVCEKPSRMQVSWLTACPPEEVTRDGWSWVRKKVRIRASLEGAEQVQCEEIPIEDSQLAGAWGNKLWRITVGTENVCEATLRLILIRELMD